MTRLLIAPLAEAQVRRIAQWWRVNRSSSPDLFSRELAETLGALLQTPTLSVHYRSRRGVRIRRLLLERSRYHVYYSHDVEADVVELRAVWHTARGSGPLLG